MLSTASMSIISEVIRPPAGGRLMRRGHLPRRGARWRRPASPGKAIARKQWPESDGPSDTGWRPRRQPPPRSEEHTSELQSLMRISYAVFCLKKKNQNNTTYQNRSTNGNDNHHNNTLKQTPEHNN